MKLKARRRLLAYAGFAVNNVLDKIRQRVKLTDSQLSAKGINARHCHTRVACSIRDRQNPTDIIWLYGDGDDVTHSVLTDAHSHIIAGARYTSTGDKFLGDKGFYVDGAGVYGLMKKLQVQNL